MLGPIRSPAIECPFEDGATPANDQTIRLKKISGAYPRVGESLIAFTLIELLVTVSILGLLAVLLFPTMGVIQKRMLQAQCMNNLRAIGALIPAYASDNGGRLPGPTPAGLYASYTKANIGDPRNLNHFFIPCMDSSMETGQTKLMKIFVCPAATKLMEPAEAANPRYYGTSATRRNNVETSRSPFGKRDGDSSNSANWV